MSGQCTTCSSSIVLLCRECSINICFMLPMLVGCQKRVQSMRLRRGVILIYNQAPSINESIWHIAVVLPSFLVTLSEYMQSSSWLTSTINNVFFHFLRVSAESRPNLEGRIWAIRNKCACILYMLGNLLCWLTVLIMCSLM